MTDSKVHSNAIDFPKTFDTLPHKRLLYKSKSHGIGGELFTWISDWLIDRKQLGVLHDGASNWLDMTGGVPLGSVLGLTLLRIYTKDLEMGLQF